jgi:hypothetical protein
MVNPALAAVLVDMQILEEHIDASGNKTYTVNTEGIEGAESEISKLTNSIDALNVTMGGTPPTYAVEVTADTAQADATVRDWATTGYMGGWGGGLPTIPVDADTGAAAASLNAFQPEPVSVPVTFDIAGMGVMAGEAVTGAAATVASAMGGGNRFGIPESIDVMINGDATDLFAATGGVRDDLSTMTKEVTVSILGNPGDALAAIDMVRDALHDIDGQTALISILGDNSDAMAAIDAVNNATIANKTSYIDVITRTSGATLTAHAEGGYVKSDLQLVGEQGPELVSLPYGSYVHTARESQRMMGGSGGTTINIGGIHIDGAGAIDADALTDRVIDRVVPAVSVAVQRAQRSMGVS